MSRYVKDRRERQPKPVERVELSEKSIGFRFAAVVLLILIAVGSFVYGINSLLSVDTGWTEIEADSAADTNIGNEFVLMYLLGSREDMSVVEENKTLISLYTDMMESAYQLYHVDLEIKDVHNLHYINNHPNQDIKVDEMLYQAFEKVQKYDNRMIYLAPIYAYYNNIFGCEDDALAGEFDPYANAALAGEFQILAGYAQDKTAVNVELLGNNTIRLNVSDAYLKYCQENDITDFVDFGWMKNAFVIDYVSDKLIANGYTTAIISSYDGFSRSLEETELGFSYNLHDYNEGNLVHSFFSMFS